MGRSYHILDVFTDEAYAGNPLAVVFDAEGLDTARCQAIAREFNLSETVFVFAPRDPINTARLRIFTPGRELPFAGHPTVGAAAILALLRAPEIIARQHLSVVLEEEIGNVQCIVRRVKGRLRASFTLPRLPELLGDPPSDSDLAQILSLEPRQIGSADHHPTMVSAGVPFVCVPLVDRVAVTTAVPNLSRWNAVLEANGRPSAVFLYCRDPELPGSHYHARMFAPAFGLHEDPATGSAVAAFAGAIVAFDRLADGDHTFVIEQGFAMGRPSLITLGLDIADGVLTEASIGGGAVVVAQGTLQ